MNIFYDLCKKTSHPFVPLIYVFICRYSRAEVRLETHVGHVNIMIQKYDFIYFSRLIFIYTHMFLLFANQQKQDKSQQLYNRTTQPLDISLTRLLCSQRWLLLLALGQS